MAVSTVVSVLVLKVGRKDIVLKKKRDRPTLLDF